METFRPVNEGAEKILNVDFKTLDKGYVVLRDYLGTDESIVAAARVSYDKGVGDKEGNNRLISFLMREGHTSPFEQCVLTFDIKAPIFVFREMIRHRTFRLNEISGRYAVLPEEYYIPDVNRVQGQSITNKQGSGEFLGEEVAVTFLEDTVKYVSSAAFDSYHEALEDGVSKELARIILPVNTYSRMRVQCDLHNLFHFLKLRLSGKAQWEIRQTAEAMANITRQCFSVSYKAFEEYVLYSKSLSFSERKILADYFNNLVQAPSKIYEIINKIDPNVNWN